MKAILPRRDLTVRRLLAARAIGGFALVLALSASVSAANTAKDLLGKAHAHLAKGHYEEAEEAFRKAADAKADAVAVSVGISRAKQAVGAWEDAEKVVAQTLQDSVRAAATPGSARRIAACARAASPTPRKRPSLRSQPCRITRPPGSF